MNVLITNFGTRGDFEPFIALAAELMKHGHDVSIAAPAAVSSMFERTTVRFRPIGRNLPEIRDAVNLSWVTDPNAYTAGARLLEQLSPLRQHLRNVLDDIIDECSRADVIVSGPAQPAARIAHDLTGVPFVSVQLSNFGGNGGPALVQAGDEMVNSLRSELGLPATKYAFTLGANSPQLTLYAMSHHLRPRPDTWPAHYHVTGFFFRDPVAPSQDLVDFIDAGAPPVLVSFGSMPQADPTTFKQILLETAYEANVRMIVQGFKPGGEYEDRMWFAEYISHGWVFPRCSCVITHGGAGTAAAVFRAGVPGIYVPHGDIYDQRYWSQLAWELGCAAEPIPVRSLSVASLHRAITRCIEDNDLRRIAKDLSRKISSENGVQRARRLIEHLVDSTGLSAFTDEALAAPPQTLNTFQ